jgi:predicted RNA-binding Zn ribbon-like protein
VASLQGVSSRDRRRFRTGRPCLDFAHTGGEGEWAVWELIHDARDLERWLGVVLDGVALTASPRDVPRARQVRHAITRLAFAAIRGVAPDAADVAAVNAAAAEPSLAPRLDGGAVRLGDGTAVAALSTLARDAIDLFGGPLAGRVRECAAENCGLLYVDASRPGTRRWCSMEVCGNRAKVRAHRGAQR